MRHGLTTHEWDALRLLARVRALRHERCVVVRAPKPGTAYLWADPVTNRTGTCRRGASDWQTAPGGHAPVLFERPSHQRDPVDIWADLINLSLSELAESMCAQYRVSLVDVLGRRRISTLPEVRARLWGAVRVATGWSTTKIGELFGVDASTVGDQVAKYCPDVELRRTRAVPIGEVA